MKYLKKFIPVAALFCSGQMMAQVTTEPSKDINPEEELKIIVDVSAFSSTDDFVANLQDSVAAGADLYIWTWSPVEHPAGHPLANGIGAQTWKNSNEALKMTKEGPTVFSYTMIPTEFYETDAQTVFDNDISFLVKTKDGGGFGDPDVKSPDLSVKIDPPSLERKPAFIFPSKFSKNDVVRLRYDNNEEEVPGMQNLHPDSAYLFISALLSDSSTVRIAQNNFTVGQFPELKLEMLPEEPGVFEKFFVPARFLGIPENLSLIRVTMFIQKPIFTGGNSRIDYDIEANMSCQ